MSLHYGFTIRCVFKKNEEKKYELTNQNPESHVAATEFVADVQVTVAKLVTAVQVVQTSMAPAAPTVLNLPAIQLATRESEAEVHVIAPVDPTTVVHGVHTSVAPSAPTVLKALLAQAETRLSELDVQV